MAQEAVGAAGPADPQVVALMQGVGDERVAVAASLTRFEGALVKSDALGMMIDSSAGAKRIREKTMAEEARMVAARAELNTAKNSLVAYGIAVYGASAPSTRAESISKPDDEDALEKKREHDAEEKAPVSEERLEGRQRYDDPDVFRQE